MSLLDVALQGAQEPSILSRPPWASTTGDEAIDLAASAGLILDPWQELSVRVILAEGVGGDWAAFETAELVARQNGKGGVIEAIELASLFLLDERLILHSAHEFKTSKEAYLRLKGIIEGAPHLVRKVKQFRQSNEETGIELVDGTRLRYMARSRSSGRGFSAQRLIIDETQILSATTMGALTPVLSAQPNPQINYFGTVPGEHDDGEHFTSLRDRGREGGDPFLAWLEWSPPSKSPDLDDPEVWAACNPALGYRLSEQAIARERASMADEDFARERLSLWHDEATTDVIDAELWASLAHVEDTRPTPVAFSVTVSPDRRWANIGLAGTRTDGGVHVQIVQTGRGTGWVPDRLKELHDEWRPVAVAVAPASPAGSLLPAIKARGIEPVTFGSQQVAQACGHFADLAAERKVHHSGQPQVAVAIGAAKRKRTAGEAWVWAPKSTQVDVSPIEAVTLAAFALASTPAAAESYVPFRIR